MIRIFGQTDTDFATNGDVVVRPLKARVHKQDNGDFYLDLETGLEYVDFVVRGNVIVAPTPQGEQAFRVGNVIKTKNKISTKAWHIFYDAKNLLIPEAVVTDKNCNDALAILNGLTVPQSQFQTVSDIPTANSMHVVRKSLYGAILDALERWGGHLYRDNFTIGIKAHIGEDNGVTVQYKKNLKEITCEEKWDEVATVLLPVGKDGVLLNAVDPNADVMVTGAVQYDIPYTKTVTFSQDDIIREDFDSDTAYLQALVGDLRIQALEYLENHSMPSVNYTLKADLEKITDVGDTVEVIDDRLGIQMMTSVIRYDYDCLLDKYAEVEFGSFQESLSGLVDNITASVDRSFNEQIQGVSDTFTEQLQEATNGILGILGDGYAIYDGNQILIVDRLPKTSANYVLRINNEGIAFSNTGINGIFQTAWKIDGTLDMESFSVINFVADLIKGGTLTVGSKENESGVIKIRNNSNALIGNVSNNGITVNGLDGSHVGIDPEVGLLVYDLYGQTILSADGQKVSMGRAKAQEVTVGEKLQFVPLQITNNGTVINDGVGIMALGGQ